MQTTHVHLLRLGTSETTSALPMYLYFVHRDGFILCLQREQNMRLLSSNDLWNVKQQCGSRLKYFVNFRYAEFDLQMNIEYSTDNQQLQIWRP